MASVLVEARAKYNEIVNMRNEISKLENSLRSCNTATDQMKISEIEGKLRNLRTQVRGAQTDFVNMANAASSLGQNTQHITAMDRVFGKLGQNINHAASQIMLYRTSYLALNQVMSALAGIPNTIMQFEAMNSKLAAIRGTTKEAIQELTRSAEELGRTTVFTATQATEMQIELAKLGFQTPEILKLQDATLLFAQAVGTNLADAAGTAGAVMRMFGGTEDQINRFTGAMTGAVMNTALDFTTIKENIAQVGPVAHSIGMEVEDVLALFGALKNAGVNGSVAATSLRNILNEMAGGKLYKQLGYQVRSLEDFVRALNDLEGAGFKGAEGVSKAMKAIGKRGGAQLLALTNSKDSLIGIRDNIAASEGTAVGQMADTMINNLSGQITMLKSAWEGFVLSFRESDGIMAKTVASITQGIRNLTDFMTAGNGDFDAETLERYWNILKAIIVALTTYKAIKFINLKVEQAYANLQEAASAEERKALEEEIAQHQRKIQAYNEEIQRLQTLKGLQDNPQLSSEERNAVMEGEMSLSDARKLHKLRKATGLDDVNTINARLEGLDKELAGAQRILEANQHTNELAQEQLKGKEKAFRLALKEADLREDMSAEEAIGMNGFRPEVQEAAAAAAELLEAQKVAEAHATDLLTASENANVLATQKSTLLKQKEAIQRRLSTAGKNSETVATKLNTTAERANGVTLSWSTVRMALHTAGTKIATTATMLWKGAIDMAKNSWRALTIAMRTNPFGLILSAVSTVISLLWTFKEETEDVAATVSEKFGESFSKESGDIESLFAILKTVDKNSKVFQKAYNGIMDAMVQYGLVAEGEKLSVQEMIDKHDELIAKLREETLEREKANKIDTLQAEYNKTVTDASENLDKELANVKGGKAAAEIIKNTLDSLDWEQEEEAMRNAVKEYIERRYKYIMGANKGQLSEKGKQALAELESMDMSQMLNRYSVASTQFKQRTGLDKNILKESGMNNAEFEQVTDQAIKMYKTLGEGQYVLRGNKKIIEDTTKALADEEKKQFDINEAMKNGVPVETLSKAKSEYEQIEKLIHDTYYDNKDAGTNVVNADELKKAKDALDSFIKERERLDKLNTKSFIHTEDFERIDKLKADISEWSTEPQTVTVKAKITDAQQELSQLEKKVNGIPRQKEIQAQILFNEAKIADFTNFLNMLNKFTHKQVSVDLLLNYKMPTKDASGKFTWSQFLPQIQSTSLPSATATQEETATTTLSPKERNAAARAAKEKRKETEKYNRLIDEQYEKLKKTELDNEFKRREALLKARKDTTAKELEQAKYDHDLQIKQLNEQKEANKKAAIDADKALWETDPSTKKERDKGATYYNSQRYKDLMANYTPTASEAALYEAKEAEIEATYNKRILELREKEIQDMRTYLKEYGSATQARIATEEEYNDQIAKAKTEGEKLRLQKEKEGALSKLAANELTIDVDWANMFKGMNGVATELVTPVLERLQAYTKTDNFRKLSPTDQKAIVDAIRDMREATGAGGETSWRGLAKSMNELKEAQSRLDYLKPLEQFALMIKDEAKVQLEAAQKVADEARAEATEAEAKFQRGEITEEERNNAIAKRDNAIKAQVEAERNFKAKEGGANQVAQDIITAQDDVNNKASDVYDKANDVATKQSDLTKTWNKIGGMFSGIEGLSEIGQLAGEIDTITQAIETDLAKGKDSEISEGNKGAAGAVLDVGNTMQSMMQNVFKEGIMQFLEIVAQIPKMIMSAAKAISGAVSGVLDSFSEFLELKWVQEAVDKILQSISRLVKAVMQLPYTIVKLIGNLAVSIRNMLGRVVNSITFGAFKSWTGGRGNARAVKKKEERLVKKIEELNDSIQTLTDSLDKTKGGFATLEEGQKARAAAEEKQKAKSDKLANRMGYNKSHHSNTYYLRRNLGSNEYNRINDILGTNISNVSEIFTIPPSQMKKIKAEARDIWNIFTESGEYDWSSYWDEYLEDAEEVDEINDTIREKLTSTTYDSMYDEFLNTLKNMDASAEDFADNFSKMMFDAMLNNYVADEYGEKLKKMYRSIADDLEKQNGELYDSQIDKYREQYKQWGQDALVMRDAIAEITGYSDVANQKGSTGSFEGMSADVGNAIEGRMTAIQMAVEDIRASRRAEQKIDYSVPLASIAANTMNISIVNTDVRDILATSYLRFVEISENTKAVVEPIQEIADNIKKVKSNTDIL